MKRAIKFQQETYIVRFKFKIAYPQIKIELNKLIQQIPYLPFFWNLPFLVHFLPLEV